VRLVCSSAVEPDDLFSFDYGTVNAAPSPAPSPGPSALPTMKEELTHNGMKVFSSWDGPLSLYDPSNDSQQKQENLSSFKDLSYACKRAVSRIHEMRSLKYQNSK